MSTTVIIIVVVVLLAVAALIPLLGYLGSSQRKALIGYAETQGWAYRDEDPELAARYAGSPFVVGSDARAEAVISGVYGGIPFAAYAYTFKPAGADGIPGPESTQTVPVVSMLVGSGLPDVDVLPRIGDAASWRPSGENLTQFGGDFANVFAVSSDDARFAGELLQPRLRDALLAHPERPWAFRGGDLLSLGSWNGKPERLPIYLDHLAMILHAVPAPEWHAYGGRPALLDAESGDRPDQPNNSST